MVKAGAPAETVVPVAVAHSLVSLGAQAFPTGKANCRGKSISALVKQYCGLKPRLPAVASVPVEAVPAALAAAVEAGATVAAAPTSPFE